MGFFCYNNRIMSRLAWLVTSLILLTGLAGLNLLAFRYFWYWQFEWFDLFMHGVGGITITLFVNGLIYRRVRDRRRVLLLSLASVLLIGAVWEVFEFTLDRYALLDTVSDILMAGLGAILGSFIFTNLNKSYDA